MKTGSNYKSSSVTATTSGVKAVDRSDSRDALILHNKGSETVRVSMDSKNDNYFEIDAGDTLSFPVAPYNEVYLATSSGSSAVSVLEG